MAHSGASQRNTAAAGYKDLSGAIGSKVFSTLVEQHTYTRMTINSWSTPRPLQGMMDIGATIKIQLDDPVEVYTYARNQTLEVQQPSLSNRELSFNSGYYYNVKIDATDEDIPAVRRFMNNLSENAGKALARQIEPAAIIKVMGGGIPQWNRGNAAGRDRNIRLGTPTEPVAITGSNITQYIANGALTLQTTPDGSEWDAGNMFALLPIVSNVSFNNSPFADLCCANRQSLLTGGLLPNIAGFDLIFYEAYVGVRTGGVVTYPILFGSKDAVAFHQGLIRKDVGVFSERSFGRYTRGLMVYGVGLIWPKKVALGFATFAA